MKKICIALVLSALTTTGAIGAPLADARYQSSARAGYQGSPWTFGGPSDDVVGANYVDSVIAAQGVAHTWQVPVIKSSVILSSSASLSTQVQVVATAQNIFYFQVISQTFAQVPIVIDWYAEWSNSYQKQGNNGNSIGAIYTFKDASGSGVGDQRLFGCFAGASCDLSGTTTERNTYLVNANTPYYFNLTADGFQTTGQGSWGATASTSVSLAIDSASPAFLASRLEFSQGIGNGSISPVSEPSSFAFMVSGIGLLLLKRSRRTRNSGN